jgi:hypothetical protein
MAWAGNHFDLGRSVCETEPVLAQYLVEGPYRFSMAFQRGSFAEFYGPSAEQTELLLERKHWLSEDSQKYLAVTDDARELVWEAMELGVEHGTLKVDFKECHPPKEMALYLGQRWEPDYLLLKRGAGESRLVCGCVCFPSSWSLEEKIGRPIEEIHAAVPGLNGAIGKQIATFLDRLKPGISWTRSNWGLSRSPERNQHPSRNTPRLNPNVTLDEVFFRVEEQSLVALPRSTGILFGIRVKVFPLKGYAGTEEGLSLARALETMPDAMVQYKGLGLARNSIIALLKG